MASPPSAPTIRETNPPCGPARLPSPKGPPSPQVSAVSKLAALIVSKQLGYQHSYSGAALSSEEIESHEPDKRGLFDGNSGVVMAVALKDDDQKAPTYAVKIFHSPELEPSILAENEITMLTSRLPPHENIVRPITSFRDHFPSNIPTLLCPSRSSSHVYTKCIIMFRYDASLQDILRWRRHVVITQHSHEAGYRPVLLEVEIRSIGAQVCGALCHLERNGVVHRSVKPDNLLLQTDLSFKVPVKSWDFGTLANSRVLLSDFGDALDVKDMKEMKEPFLEARPLYGGSSNLTFIPPEIHQATPGPGKFRDYSRADTYALGVTLLNGMAVLTGEESIEHEVKVAHARNVLASDPLFASHYSRDIRALVWCLTEPDPQMRLTVQDAYRVFTRLWNHADDLAFCLLCDSKHAPDIECPSESKNENERSSPKGTTCADCSTSFGWWWSPQNSCRRCQDDICSACLNVNNGKCRLCVRLLKSPPFLPRSRPATPIP